MQPLIIRYSLKFHECNLRCPYCVAHVQARQSRFNNSRYRQVLEKIVGLDRKIVLQIATGGEPFLSSEIIGGVAWISKQPNIDGVSLLTNLQVNDDRLDLLINNARVEKLGIGCSLHDTQISDIDGFFRKIAKLKDKGIMAYVTYVGLPDKIKQAEQYKKKCDEIGVVFTINGLIGKYNGKRYPQAYSDMEKARFKTLCPNEHEYMMQIEAADPHGKMCEAGVNYIFIDDRGDVYRCNPEKKKFYLISRLMQAKLGNILRRGAAFYPAFAECRCNECHCPSETIALHTVSENFKRTRVSRLLLPK